MHRCISLSTSFALTILSDSCESVALEWITVQSQGVQLCPFKNLAHMTRSIIAAIPFLQNLLISLFSKVIQPAGHPTRCSCEEFSERKQSLIVISFNRIHYFLKKSRRTRFLVLKNLYGGWPLAIHLYLNETKSLGWAGCPLLGSKRPPQCRSVAILQLAHSLPTSHIKHNILSPGENVIL